MSVKSAVDDDGSDMSDKEMICVEVAFALPQQQKIIALEVESGTTALHAAEQSGIARYFPGLELEGSKMGVFGKAVKGSHYVLKAGDRIEIYRPLTADPKAVRKKRAAAASAAKKTDT